MSHSINAAQLFVRDSRKYRPASYQELVAAARKALAQEFVAGCSLDQPALVKDYLRCAFADREYESFVLILLDAHNRLLACLEMFRGSATGAAVHPREIVKKALKYNAVAVVVAHNHPSGVAEPSPADELVTRRLKEALALVEIRLIDHLVVGGDDVVSFLERGLM